MVLVVILLAAARQEARKTYLLAFFTGVLTDLLLGRGIGQTAIFLLAAVGSVYLYKLRGKVNPFVFLAFVVVWETIAKFLWG